MPRFIGLILTAMAIAVFSIATHSSKLLFAQVKVEEKKMEAPKLEPKKGDAKKDEPKVEIPLRKSADGFPIPKGAIHRFGNRQLRHADGVYNAVVSPDGKLMATRGQQTVVVWDLETLNAKQVFGENEGGQSYYAIGGGMAFSPDSKSLLMTQGRTTYARPVGGGGVPRPTAPDVAALWDLETGKKKIGVRGGSVYQSAVWFNADGKSFSTFTDYQIIRHFDATDGKALTTTTLVEPLFQNVFLSPAGDLVTGVNNQQLLKVFDTQSGKEKYGLDKIEVITQLAISPDSKTLVVQTDDSKIHLHDLEQKKELFAFDHPAEKQAGPLRISKDGKTLYFGGTQGQLYRWDLKENRRLPDIGSHSTWTLTAIALSPDEKTFYSTGMDRLIRRWDLATNKELPLPNGYITQTTFLPDFDRKSVMISDHVGCIDFWDLKTGKLVSQFHKGGTDGINHLAKSSDARWLAAGCTTQAVKIWDLQKANAEAIRIPLTEDEKKQSGTDHVQRVAFSPDTKLLYCNSEKTGLSALEVPSGKPVWNVEKVGYSFRLDPSGRYVVAGGGNYNNGPVKINVIDAKTGKILRVIQPEPLSTDPNSGMSVAWVADFIFLPSGLLLTSHYDGTLRLFDVEVGKERKRFQMSDRRTVGFCACSPDGKWLALSSSDRRLRILELASGKEVYALGNHDSSLTQLTFTLDGRGVLSSADLAPLLWDLKPAELPKPGKPEEIWELLASQDAATVYRLQWALMEAPDQIKAIFDERVKPEEWFFDRKRYDQLITNLDTPRFAVREAAQKELTESQKIPLAWLRESFQTIDSEECKDRLRRVLDIREKQPAVKEWRIARSVQVLEQIGNGEAKAMLKKWSVSSEGSVLANNAKEALERLEKR